MDDVLVPVFICALLFIGLPWLIMHYVTKWKTAPTLTSQDEELLEDLYQHARRLNERLETIERIVAADNPEYRIETIRDAEVRYLDPRRK